MSYDIMNAQGCATTRNEIDRIACQFWNQEYSQTCYAKPDESRSLNWNTFIGGVIDKTKANTWELVKQELGSPSSEYSRPYRELCDHLNSLGYTPQYAF